MYNAKLGTLKMCKGHVSLTNSSSFQLQFTYNTFLLVASPIPSTVKMLLQCASYLFSA